MLNLISALLTYPFLLRALLAGILLSFCLALLGVILVAKQYSMIGDGLSHISFSALALSFCLSLPPLLFSIPLCLLMSFILLKLSESKKSSSDALIALTSSVALAVGITVSSLSKGLNIDLSSFMFGSILSINKAELLCILVESLLVLLFFITCHKQIFLVSFDATFAKTLGLNVHLYNTLFSLLTSLSIVTGLRLIGALLISSLIVFPYLTASRVTHSFLATLILSALLGVTSFVLGFITSYLLSAPVGSCTVLVSFFLYLLFYLLSFALKR